MRVIISISLIFLLSSCGGGATIINPFTTVPAALLGAYDKINKRKTWKSYAEKGDVYAQYELGVSYCCKDFEGAVNHRESFRWFCEAAKNGYAKAQIELGMIYGGRKKFDQIDLPQDNIKSYMWYNFAAKRMNRTGIRLKKALQRKLTEEELQQVQELMSNPDSSKASCLIDVENISSKEIGNDLEKLLNPL